MAKQITRETMVDRAVSKGMNRAVAAELLDGLLATHGGDNLAAALVYWDFTTEAQAYRYIAQAAGQ